MYSKCVLMNSLELRADCQVEECYTATCRICQVRSEPNEFPRFAEADAAAGRDRDEEFLSHDTWAHGISGISPNVCNGNG